MPVLTGATLDRATFDGAKAEAFGGRMMPILTGSLLSSMVDIGHRTGLFAAAAEGRATSEQLAARAGLCERYVREWLGAMTTGGIVEYDQAAGTFLLPPEHAALLISPAGVGPLAVTNTVIAGHVHQIARAFREGGGVPYAAFSPEFTDAMDAIGRGLFDTMLVDGYLPLAPGLAETLTAGARVADVACGTGHALIILARAFPASTFTGYDLDEHAIARARAEAAGAGLENVTFEVARRGPAHRGDALRRGVRLRRPPRSGRARRRCWPGSTSAGARRPAVHARAARRRHARRRTWPTRWRPSCTRSAPCTA